jgi:hypothetical protein
MYYLMSEQNSYSSFQGGRAARESMTNFQISTYTPKKSFRSVPSIYLAFRPFIVTSESADPGAEYENPSFLTMQYSLRCLTFEAEGQYVTQHTRQ